jgi:hypothetical protein
MLRSVLIAILMLPLSAGAVDFAREVYPALQRACFECHGPDHQKGELRLDTNAAVKHKAIVAGKPEASDLIRRVSLPKEDKEAMPRRGERLSQTEITNLKAWIAAGAVWPEQIQTDKHWAYVKPVRPALPEVKNKAWAKTDIDRFILAKQEAAGVTPAPEASPAALIRRLSLDLTGLPPSVEEVVAFENECRAGDKSFVIGHSSLEQLVDRLLASQEFGVRWARPWLDLARYADSHGFQRDDLRSIWGYRDWVVNALNADLPFDQFTIEQVAGDLLPNATPQQIIATGFHRCTPTNVEAGTEPEESRINQVIDRVNTTGAVWLGTTLECAQCHNHKYDPFSQRDYYGLLDYFNNTEKEAERTNPKVPGSIQFKGVPFALSTAKNEALVAKLQPQLQVIQSKLENPEDLAPREVAKLRKQAAAIEKQLAAAKAPTSEVMRELPEPRMTAIFKRGVYTDPGDAVTAGSPAIIEAKAAGTNRLALARWLVSKDNPLTARVTVNRWWAEIFGQGLVTTVEDFGIKGAPPTHPELLDWLAIEFMEHGWSMKHILKQIVMSATYRQASEGRRAKSEVPEPYALSPLLYAQGPRFRMDAEMIRDNALSIAGLINLKQGGEPIRPPQPDGLWQKVGGQQYKYEVSLGAEQHRRGLYVVLKRGSPYPSFTTFDAGPRMACVVKRSRSNTPLQALTLLNDPVYVAAAKAFAERIQNEAAAKPLADQIAHAFRIALSRAPSRHEAAVLQQLWEAQMTESKNETAAWYAVATALLNLDETITKN